MYSSNNPPDIFGLVADYINLHIYTSENTYTHKLAATGAFQENPNAIYQTFLQNTASQNTFKRLKIIY